jgi:hypothetical protein
MKSVGELEAWLLLALYDRSRPAVRKLAAEIAALDLAARRSLNIRVRDDAVEFRFVGEFPGAHHLGDGSGSGEVEFILSESRLSGSVRSRCYQSLCLVDEAGLERLEAVWTAVKRVIDVDKAPPVEFRLLWTEDGGSRSEDLLDVCRLEEPKRHADCLRDLKFARGGLRTCRFRVDLAALPKSPQAVQVLVVIRPAFLDAGK